ncbi:restriction endonuclease subunit S [Aerococcus urinaeequi]|uniref:restriction endonuclease subunit S n=1 Tax=Aerococcus urinaeequi TaxID=51665 RepID=UPI003D6BB1E1
MGINKDAQKAPNLRFKGFTDDWEHRKLGELAEILRGASPRPIQSPQWFNEKSEVGWLRISDVTEQNGRIHFLKQRLSKLGESKTRVLLEPHLLLSIAASVGKPVINYVKTGVHDGFLIFYNPSFNEEFMFHWLDMYRPKWQKYGQPGSQVNLNSELVKNQDLFIPNIEEQDIISIFLQNIELFITLHQRKLDQLKQLKEALLQQMFPAKGETVPKLRFAGFEEDWEERKVKELFNITRGQVLATSKTSQSPTAIFKYPVFSSQTKNEGLMGYYSEYLFENAITWTTDGANAGTVNFRKGKFYSTNVNGVLLSNDGYANKCVAEIINRVAWKYVSKVGNPKLMNNVMSDIIIKVPNLEEQNVIGKVFEKLDNTITLQQRKLDQIKNTKQVLLQNMFI